jgi:DNA invertase Pin-like site-specific DNA recombinase
VSTEDQSTERQILDLEKFGCTEIFRENASGADRDRPQLKAVLGRVRKGDTLVVVRIDRLARSLSHLLSVIETLGRKGIDFKSLGDPINTGSPQGKFTLQILGAVAEFERGAYDCRNPYRCHDQRQATGQSRSAAPGWRRHPEGCGGT